MNRSASRRIPSDLAAPRAPQLGLPIRTRQEIVAPSPPPSPSKPRRVRSEELFPDGVFEVLIEHRGGEYRLRLTRQDRLILNK